jgi:hypothetical protein
MMMVAVSTSETSVKLYQTEVLRSCSQYFYANFGLVPEHRAVREKETTSVGGGGGRYKCTTYET